MKKEKSKSFDCSLSDASLIKLLVNGKLAELYYNLDTIPYSRNVEDYINNLRSLSSRLESFVDSFKSDI